MCDLSKAFDSVSHEILLKKIYKLRIDPFWFSSYLCKRTLSVRIGTHASHKLKVLYWVPQGSVLEPILFLLYVIELSHYISGCHVIQYADDTQLIHTGNIENIHELIHRGEKTLSKAKRYFHTNALMLNTNKTQCMFVGSRGLTSQIPPNTSLQVDGTTIIPSTSLKNLGICFDIPMTFDTHSKISGKIFGTIIYIHRI